MRSAFSVAASIDLMVASKSTTTPLRMPRDGASPTPMISSPLGPSAATTAQVFVVPISSPQTVSCFIRSLISIRRRQALYIGEAEENPYKVCRFLDGCEEWLALGGTAPCE